MAAPPDSHTERPSLRELTRVFAQIGVLSFGGPAGQIALMHRMLVEERRWISESRFLHALNFCMLLPGPEAQQLATYIGWLLHGTRGGLIAGTLFVLPGFAVILALSAAYALWQDVPLLDGLFYGLKAAVLALVLQAVIRVGRRSLRSPGLVAVAILAFLALHVLELPFPLVILAAGLAGYVGSRAGGPVEPAPDDLVDRLPHLVAPSIGRTSRLVATWGFLWVAPVAGLALAFGPESVFLPIAGYFSVLSVVTFGGAYAVLGWVAQQAVETWGWLAPGEMMDGLALAETTPGPLILVLAFVGFLAAFRESGGLDPLVAGVLGATLTTWVTFVPCFLWIFLGAPHVERLRGNRALAGALSAVTAAVVGVILDLTVWFALHVFFADLGMLELGPLRLTVPVLSTIDPLAVALAGMAAILLFATRLGLAGTLAACALAGLALTTDWGNLGTSLPG